MLHITNGDSVGEMLASLDCVEGEILCWRDVLHDGPLQLLPFKDYARQRADFLAESLAAQGITEPDEAAIYADLQQRQKSLDGLSRHEEVVLWFEHDLYDQLQLAEILHCLAADKPPGGRLSLICIGDYPGVEPFHGLGNLAPSQLATLWPTRQPVTEQQLMSGRRIWRALCAEDPGELATIAAQGVPGLPFMAPALCRFCREFPHSDTGLTLTQWHLLTLARRHEPATFAALFGGLQELESAPFMGDTWVVKELLALSRGEQPLLVTDDAVRGPYRLTPAGQRVMAGQGSWPSPPDLWRGGVHVTAANRWRWQPDSERLVRETV